MRIENSSSVEWELSRKATLIRLTRAPLFAVRLLQRGETVESRISQCEIAMFVGGCRDIYQLKNSNVDGLKVKNRAWIH